MRSSWHQFALLLALLAGLAPVEAQQTAAPPDLSAGPANDPALFPSGPGSSNPTDFSGSGAAPASSFGTPDFSGSSLSGAAAAAGGSGSTGGASGTRGAGSASARGGGTGGASGTNGTATGTGGSATPGTTSFEPGAFSSPASTTPTTPNGVAAPASVFGTTALGSGTGLGAGAGSGTAGLGGANTRTPSPSTAASFTLPSSYGQAPLTFAVGQGRLARPRYVFTGTAQMGYDDNVLQTPTAANGSPAASVNVLVSPARPPETVVVEVPPTGPTAIGVAPVPTFETVTIPGQKAVYRKVLVRAAIPAQPRIGSVVARTGIGFEMQLASRKTVFTADAHVDSSYYVNRPSTNSDTNGNLSLVFAHRITGRLQFSATANVAYLSQPDLRVVSGPTRNVGDYITGNVKADLTYRWSKRISTVTSLTENTLFYQNAVQKANDSYETIFGTEGRYIWNSKLTLLVEGRASKVLYPQSNLRDSTTYFILGGAEYALTKRLSGTIRVGESIRSFDNAPSNSASATSSSPYAEVTAAYRFSQTGSLTSNSRFGFEEPQDASSEVLVFRTTLSAVQAFSARLRGSASVGYIHRVTDSTQNALSTTITGNTFTADVGLDYAITRKFSVNASYSFVNDLSSLDQTGYYRNQIFLGAQYTY